MTAGERFRAWVDGVATSWADRLRGWMASWILKGVEDTFEDLEPKPREALTKIIDELIASPATPDTIKPTLKKIRAHGSPAWLTTILIMLGAMVGATLLAQFTPSIGGLRYAAERIAKLYRFDPATITSIWRRDKPAYEKFWEDLKDQGWDEERIEVAKELAKIIPPLPDMVRFADFSAFDPEVIEKWREFYDAPGWISDPMSLIGITNEPPRDWANKYWFSHWIQPGRFELGEIYRRGLLGEPLIGQEEVGGAGGEGEAEKMVKLAYRTMGYSPFWQDMLLELVREVPTRVDVRRWWDMRTIDETELRSIYQRRGYFGKDLENYVVWTKVYVAFPDLIARWSKGWISEEEVRSELTATGMPAERVDELIQTKIKKVAPDRVAGERDLTKTDIYKGVKAGAITRGEAAELLIDLGFDEEEADYLLDINIPTDEEDVVVKERELTKSDIKAAVKEQILTLPEATSRLILLRYSPADAEFITSIYAAQIAIEEVEPQRELTKGDITSALRKGILLPGEVRPMLLGLGYSAEDTELLISTNMPTPEQIEEEKARQVSKADIKTGLKTGILTAEQAEARLVGIGYTPEDAGFLISLFTEFETLKQFTKPKEESKSDIVLAVKRGLITSQEAYLMLQDIDFTPEASEFILAVRAEETPFSPVNFAEFKDLTRKYRIATGKEEKPMPEEIKTAASLVVTLTGEVEALARAIVEEQRGLIGRDPIPAAATKRLKSLQVKRNRAISKLETAKSEYDRLGAEWKHGLP